MAKLHPKARLKHLFQWFKVFVFIMRNRGRKTYGSFELRRMVERYLVEYSTSIENMRAAEQSFIDMESLLRVTGVNGLTRIGAANDGGYIGILSPANPSLISGGGGKNIDFEIELAERGSKIHIYDPTIKKLPRTHKNIIHKKIALAAPEDKTFKRSVTLTDAVSALNPDDEAPIWLKLDIEGSEIGLLASDLRLLSRFQQIFIEFHDSYKVAQPNFRNQLMGILNTLCDSHHVISVVSNNWQGFSNYGYAFAPVTFEVTFLSKEYDVEFSELGSYRNFKNVNNINRLEIPDVPFQTTK